MEHLLHLESNWQKEERMLRQEVVKRSRSCSRLPNCCEITAAQGIMGDGGRRRPRVMDLSEGTGMDFQAEVEPLTPPAG